MQVGHCVMFVLCIYVIRRALFLWQMLSETIMHECVVRLLRSPVDEESLECFARLIATTGKDLDHPQAKVWGEGGGGVYPLKFGWF